MKRYIFATLALALAVAPASALPPSNPKTLEHATEILDDLAGIPFRAIPAQLLADAQGVAIIPHVVKAGFLFGGQGGHGFVMAKDKEGRWSDPVFVNLGGASVGFQAGVESTDVVLVFRSRKSLDRLLEGKAKFTLGADAAIAAGPVGRMAQAATDVKLEAEILAYSRTRGLFAGVAFDGAVLTVDAHSNALFRKSAEEMKVADTVKVKLAEMSRERPPLRVVPVLHPPVIIPLGP